MKSRPCIVSAAALIMSLAVYADDFSHIDIIPNDKVSSSSGSENTNSAKADKIDINSPLINSDRVFPGDIAGTVTDSLASPLAGVFVLVEGTFISDTTDSNGEYFLAGVDPGETDVSFNLAGYHDTTITGVSVISSDTTDLGVELISESDVGLLVWYGNLDNSPIAVGLNNVVDINVYLQTQNNAYVADMLLSLGVQDQYIDSLMAQSDGEFYYPFTEWEVAEFRRSYGSPPNPEGWSSQSFMGFACLFPIPGQPSPWLHTETPILGMKFVIRTANNTDNMGHIVHCLGAGIDSIQGYSNAGDTLGGLGYHLSQHYSPFHFSAKDILGNVTNQDGYPIYNVYVEVIDDPHHDYTDVDGDYILNDLLPGYYDVRFTHPGVTPHTEYNVRVFSNQNTVLNVQLQELGNLAGTVTNPDMAPIESVLVKVSGTSDSTYTDGSGQYILELIETGNRTVLFSHPDYFDQTRNIQITPVDTATLDVIMPYLGAIDGLVRDINSLPVQGVYVILGDTIDSAITGIDGRFFFDKLDPGNYSITLTHPDYNLQTVTDIPVISGDTTEVLVTLEYLAVIAGTVTKTDGITLLADVQLQLIQNSIPIDSFTTVANGYYEFHHLAEGYYDIEASKTGYVTQTIGNIYAQYDDTAMVDILLVQDIGIIEGNVTGNSSPLDSVHITVLSTVHNDFSDAAGDYEILDVPGGTYNLKFYKPGYQDYYSLDVVVLPEQTTIVNAAVDEKQYDLALSLFTNPFYRSGQDAFYSCVCLNIGSYAAENVILQLSMPAEATYLSSDPIGTYADGVVTWNLGNVASLEELHFMVEVNISGSAPIGDYLNAEAHVSLDNSDFDLSNNSASVSAQVVSDWNSHDKIAGPPGIGPRKFISGSDKLNYGVFFENEAGNPGNVNEVIVSDTLDADLDWDTFILGPTSHDLSCIASFDYSTGAVTWTFTGLGLPPNDTPPEGEGFVTYGALPNILNVNEEEIINLAAVKFDEGDWVLCPEPGPLLRTLDLQQPESQIGSLPPLLIGVNEVLLEWTESDLTGSGIATVDIYVSANAGPYELWHTAGSGEYSYLFTGEFENCYSFYSVATDSVGNVEDVPVDADASICLQFGFGYLPGDANMGIGLWPPQVIGADVTYLVNYFRSLAEPCLLWDFYASADVNGDCSVLGSDVTRLVNYFRQLVPVGYCLDFPPAWPTEDDIPEDPPTGWPNCGLEAPPDTSTPPPPSAGIAFVADRAEGLQIIDLRDIYNPYIIGSVDVNVAYDVFVQGDFAYVVDDVQNRLIIINVSDLSNPVVESFLYTTDRAWGIYVRDNYAYVVTSDGLSTIDISDPSNPYEAGSYLPYSVMGGIDVYGDYAYVSSDNSQLEIIDISDPQNPFGVSSIGNGYPRGDVVYRGTRLYLPDSNYDLMIFDVEDPYNPAILGHSWLSGSAFDLVMYGSLAFVIAYGEGINIVNISNASNPYFVSFIPVPESARSITVHGRYFYVTNIQGLLVYEFDSGDGGGPGLNLIASIPTPGSAFDVFVTE